MRRPEGTQTDFAAMQPSALGPASALLMPNRATPVLIDTGVLGDCGEHTAGLSLPLRRAVSYGRWMAHQHLQPVGNYVCITTQTHESSTMTLDAHLHLPEEFLRFGVHHQRLVAMSISLPLPIGHALRGQPPQCKGSATTLACYPLVWATSTEAR